jgi:hypothetical protein
MMGALASAARLGRLGRSGQERGRGGKHGTRLVTVPRIAPERWAEACGVLRAQATAQLIEVGELLGNSALSPDQGEEQVLREYLLALDAHAAAGKVLDETDELPDLAGAAVLLDIAIVHFRAALARHEGKRPSPPAHRCFYNPLHGAAVYEPDRGRERGPRKGAGGSGGRGSGRKRRAAKAEPKVPACAACLHRIHQNESPDVLVVPVTLTTKKGPITGVPVPYYLLAAGESLWAATGYGTRPGHSDAELVARVLRGEHRTHAIG